MKRQIITTPEVPSSPIYSQAISAAILAVAGASLGDVVRVLVLLKESRDFDAMNRVYSRHFPTDPPTRAVARFGVDVGNLLVSMVMTAWVGGARDGSAVELLTSG